MQKYVFLDRAVDTGYTFAGIPWKVPFKNPRPDTVLLEKCGRSFHTGRNMQPSGIASIVEADVFCMSYREMAQLIDAKDLANKSIYQTR